MKFFLFFNFLIFFISNFAQSDEIKLPNIFMIKFSGPIRAIWTEELEKLDGAERIYSAYFKENSLLYYIKSRVDFEKIKKFPFIKEIKEYLPEYKTKINYFEKRDIKVRIKLIGTEFLGKLFGILKSKNSKILNVMEPVHYLEKTSVLVVINTYDLYDILKIPEVLFIEEVKPVVPTLSTAREIIQTGLGDGCLSNADEVPVWVAGINGSGPLPRCDSDLGTEQLIGIIDTSFLNPDLECDLGVPNCSIYKYIIYNTSTTPPCNIENSVNYCEGGYGHGTAAAGIILSNGSQSGGESPVELCSYKGISFGSRLWALKCDKNFGDFDCFNNCNGGDYLIMLRDFFLSSFADGSRLSNHSWTSYVNGEYDSASELVDIWAYDNDNLEENGLKQEYLWFFSTGNTGPNPNTIGSPGTAKNDISVGAFYNGVNSWCYTSCDNAPCDEKKLVCYSSRGPTDDGRYGPEVAGPSQIIRTLANGSGYVGFAGTSASTPAITATGALIRDWLINIYNISNPSAPLIKALLLNSTDYINLPSENLPGTGQGWGKPNLSNLCDDWSSINCQNIRSLWFEGSFNDSSEIQNFKFYVNSNSFPLKIILTYFDPPNLLGGGALINNLNLKITAPDSTVYIGNNFTGAWSESGEGTFDSTNNTEGIRVQEPQIGLWQLEVICENLPQGPQTYAVALSGDITAYTSPKPIPDGTSNTMPLKVEKLDMDGSQLKIFWDSQCNPENTNIIYGPLSALSNYQISGSKCGISNPDIFNIGSVTNIWFLLVSDDGFGTESSWGFSSNGQRNGTNPSNQCGNIKRDNEGTCP